MRRIKLFMVGLAALALAPMDARYSPAQANWAGCDVSHGKVRMCNVPFGSNEMAVVRYATPDGQGTHTYAAGGSVVHCDSLGDMAAGKHKDCTVRRAEAEQTPPTSGYRKCANYNDVCNAGGTGDAPVWMRYGNGKKWVYGLVAGSKVHCFQYKVGDSVALIGGAEGPVVCEVGPPYSGVTANTKWEYCGTDGSNCNLPTATQGGTRLVRYGANGEYAYRIVTSGNAAHSFGCNPAVFQNDPLAGTMKTCQYAVPAVDDPQYVAGSAKGRWNQIGSCEGTGCVVNTGRTVKVERSSSATRSKKWSNSLMVGLQVEYTSKTLVADITATAKTENTFTTGGGSQQTDTTGRGASSTQTVTCAATPAGMQSTALYQYVLDFEETCLTKGKCPSTLFTSQTACIAGPPSPNFKPACQPGCFANDLGTVCKPAAECQRIVHPEFANLTRPAVAQPAATQPAAAALPPAPQQAGVSINDLRFPPEFRSEVEGLVQEGGRSREEMQAMGITSYTGNQAAAPEQQQLPGPIANLRYPPEWEGDVQYLIGQGTPELEIQQLIDERMIQEGRPLSEIGR